MITKENRVKIIQGYWIKYLFIVILMITSIRIILAPIHKKTEFEKLVSNDSIFVSMPDTIWNDYSLSPIIREYSYNEAMFNLSKNDSIQLVVNLHDSTVNLFIKGVQIHKTKIKHFGEDNLLLNISNKQYLKLFSKPLNIKKQKATIVKEPIVLRHAPKDTADAAINAWKPDTLVQNPAFVSYILDYGINIIFEQEMNNTLHDKYVKNMFYLKIRFNRTYKAVFDLLLFKKPEYIPVIKIKIPVNELRAVYRALPVQPIVVLYLH